MRGATYNKRSSQWGQWEAQRGRCPVRPGSEGTGLPLVHYVPNNFLLCSSSPYLFLPTSPQNLGEARAGRDGIPNLPELGQFQVQPIPFFLLSQLRVNQVVHTEAVVCPPTGLGGSGGLELPSCPALAQAQPNSLDIIGLSKG